MFIGVHRWQILLPCSHPWPLKAKTVQLRNSSLPCRHLPPAILSIALRKLDMVNAAAVLEDLKVPPGNKRHPLKDELAGFYAIRVNDQWRIILRWQGSDAFDVQITDYH